MSETARSAERNPAGTVPSLRERLVAVTPLQWSAGLHSALALVIFGVVFGDSWLQSRRTKLEVTILENPKESSAVDLQKLPPPKPKPKKVEPRHEVFGASRKAIRADEGEESAQIKDGNTTAKAPDAEKLRPEDEDSIPIPTDEYLVSEMPQLISDFRVPYPAEAKKRRIQGAVVMELLIDEKGGVRRAELVEGPGFGLDEAALEAARRLKFRPARVQDQSVAVKIRYVYRFILEN